jgi:hypothetical protein
MCDHCHFPEPVRETRRSFLRKLAGGAVSAALVGNTRAAAQGKQPQVAKAGWARLVTSSPYWNFHQDRDPTQIEFIQQNTHLKIDPTVYSVKPSSLDGLCAFPFIFTNNLTAVRNVGDLANIREYLYRGGFIYIDGCVNLNVTPSFSIFYKQHLALLAHLVPGSQVLQLPSSHPIFRERFPMDERVFVAVPGAPATDTSPQWQGAIPALYGVFDDDRMVALLSLEHLLCGWPDNPGKMPNALREITNIYVYALAH